jgi:hypothetical protein
MNISLRKANNIQHQLNNLIQLINPNFVETLSAYSEITEDQVAELTTASQAEVARKIKLINVLYNLRQAIGEANANSGINAKLTELANIQRQISVYHNYTSQRNGSEAKTFEVAQGMLNSIRNSNHASSAYGITTSNIRLSILTDDFINECKAAIANLTKAKTTIQDEVLQMNINYQIILSELDVEALKAEQIV